MFMCVLVLMTVLTAGPGEKITLHPDLGLATYSQGAVHVRVDYYTTGEVDQTYTVNEARQEQRIVVVNGQQKAITVTVQTPVNKVRRVTQKVTKQATKIFPAGRVSGYTTDGVRLSAEQLAKELARPRAVYLTYGDVKLPPNETAVLAVGEVLLKLDVPHTYFFDKPEPPPGPPAPR